MYLELFKHLWWNFFRTVIKLFSEKISIVDIWLVLNMTLVSHPVNFVKTNWFQRFTGYCSSEAHLKQILKKGPSKIKPVNNMKWYGLLKQIISLFKSCFPQLGLFLNNLFHLETPTNVCDIPYSKNTYPLLTINYFYNSFIRDIYRVINTSPMLLIKIYSSLSLQIRLNIFYNVHSVKSVCIWSYSGPYFPALGLSPYFVQMQENVDKNNSEYGHFSRSGVLS